MVWNLFQLRNTTQKYSILDQSSKSCASQLDPDVSNECLTKCCYLDKSSSKRHSWMLAFGKRHQFGASQCRLPLFAVNLTIFCVSIICLSLSVNANFRKCDMSNPRNHLLKQTSFYSPVLDALDIPLMTKQINATLLHPHPYTIFRQEPSPEVDKAWHFISDLRPIAVSGADVLSLGKSISRAAKWPLEYGLGNDAYYARIDVFHQIHCLDSLRREAWFDYYYGAKYPGGVQNTTKKHKLHISHCIFILLENIMCNANVDIYTHFYTDIQDGPMADFKINKKCRDFDTLLDWQQKHGVEETDSISISRPEEYGPAHKMTREYKEIFGWYETHEDDGIYGDEIA